MYGVPLTLQRSRSFGGHLVHLLFSGQPGTTFKTLLPLYLWFLFKELVDVIVLKVMLRLFTALVANCPVTFKHVTGEWNRFKFGTCRLLAVHISSSILGHPVHSLGVKERLCKFACVAADVKQSTKVLCYFIAWYVMYVLFTVFLIVPLSIQLNSWKGKCNLTQNIFHLNSRLIWRRIYLPCINSCILFCSFKLNDIYFTESMFFIVITIDILVAELQFFLLNYCFDL